jgi:hypothetical protein
MWGQPPRLSILNEARNPVWDGHSCPSPLTLHLKLMKPTTGASTTVKEQRFTAVWGNTGTEIRGQTGRSLLHKTAWPREITNPPPSTPFASRFAPASSVQSPRGRETPTRNPCNSSLRVGGTLVRFRRPTDAQQRSIHPASFRTWPPAHTVAKLIVFCPTFAVSMRSAITRSASASTAASASDCVAP